MHDLFYIYKIRLFYFKKVISNKNLYITKLNKGCSVVLLNKVDYQQKLCDIINNSEKNEEIHAEKKRYS